MTNKLKLIGLTGPAGCGKDTVARIICDTQEFIQISLAEPIKRGLSAMLGLSIDTLTDRELKEKPLAQYGNKTPRQLMQTLGTEWGRNMVDQHIWLNVAQQQINYINRIAQNGDGYIAGIVISDIRFPGEAKWLRDQGGTIWHIRRPDNPFATKSEHESEIPLIPQDNDQFVINDGDIDALFETVTNLMQRIEEAA